MSWNYRVVKFVGEKDVNYSVREVYYADDGAPEGYTEHPSSPVGDSIVGEPGFDALLDFSHALTLWSRAFEKPVLIVDTTTEKFTGKEEPPVMPPQLCDECSRPMIKRETWVCPTHGEDSDL